MDPILRSYEIEDAIPAKRKLARDLYAWAGCFTGVAVGIIKNLAGIYETGADGLSVQAREMRRPPSWHDEPGGEMSHWGDD